MQTLGISDGTSRSEGRLKSLLWPSIESNYDAEYLAVQGYWVCTVVAAISFCFLLTARQPILGTVLFVLFYLGAVGVREHNRFAATTMFAFYVLDTFAGFKILLLSPGVIVLRVVISVLLLSNLRATWIATHWQSGSEAGEQPLRVSDTLGEKFANQWPAWLWPKVRVVYYILSTALLLLFGIGLAAIALGLGPRK